MPDLSDVDLLRTDLETLWVRDARGRMLRTREPGDRAAPHLVIATARDGRIVDIGSVVPDALADHLRSTVDETPLEVGPSTAPAALDRCVELLRGTLGPVQVTAGPHYWLPPGTTFESDVTIVGSDIAEGGSFLFVLADGANWGPDEWQRLLNGSMGPWAFALVDNRVVAMCHCARLWERGASAGVWTHPKHRGRGYAASLTAAWAALTASPGRELFYSTSSDNAASQRVAAKLGLRPIGWTWRVSAAPAG